MLSMICKEVKQMFLNIFKQDLPEQPITINLKVNEKRIVDWLFSKHRLEQITGDKYYKGIHDILFRKRTAIGANGELIQVDNLPNNKIVDNLYKKIVDQKINYLVSKSVTFSTDNVKYQEQLDKYFNYDFDILMKAVCTDSLNCGVGWLYSYYDEKGNFKLKRFAPYEILPIWADEEKTELEFVIRFYDIKTYINGAFKICHKVEIYKQDGIEYYDFINNRLIQDTTKESGPYFKINNKNYNWGKIPITYFKYNYFMLPLIRDLKTLQDVLNTALSDWQNNMQEDSRNSILVLKNYDGENLGEFRQNLATYGAVKIREDGDVKLCSGNEPNELQIKSVLNDIDMDANSMDLEFKHSLKRILWFFKADLANRNIGNFFNDDTEIIFNKDQITNESQVINDIKNSVGIVSHKTLLKNHPYVYDVEQEEKQIQEEHLANNNIQINDIQNADNNKVLKKKRNSFDEEIKKGVNEAKNE